jgi:hypothetical protein
MYPLSPRKRGERNRRTVPVPPIRQSVRHWSHILNALMSLALVQLSSDHAVIGLADVPC